MQSSDMIAFPQQIGKSLGTLRASEVVQGLFPGIVGVPRQGDLAVNPSPFAVALPAQKARRLQATGKWETGVDHTRHQHHLKGSISWFQREELAPPHAHGWGPEPDSNLSLHLEEWTGFIESVWKGAHGSIGLQAEGLNAKASGWEFLVPDHTRLRTSAIGEGAIGKHTLGLRTDLIWTSQAAYSEPLYDSNNTLVGSDIRSESMRRFIPGGMLSWQYTIEPAEAHWKGTASATAYSRAPSNYELGPMEFTTVPFDLSKDRRICVLRKHLKDDSKRPPYPRKSYGAGLYRPSLLSIKTSYH